MCIRRIYEKENQNNILSEKLNHEESLTDEIIYTDDLNPFHPLFQIIAVQDVEYEMMLLEYYERNKKYTYMIDCMHILLSLLTIMYLMYILVQPFQHDMRL